MIDRQHLLRDLQALLPKIEQDILAYAESKPQLIAHLQGEYAKAKAANRTAEHFVAWREAQITQAAVAWILTCVFVRFLEDNALLDAPLISGPAGGHKQSRLQQAKDRLTVYFNDHPTHAEREYLQNLFKDLEQLPAMGELLDHAHNPLWQLPLSADGAKQLIDFFQRLDPETGESVHDFTDRNWDTRFLGDLYQDLSESVRKRYALLQTPEFVESFILDYTLEPAKVAFGLPGLRLIDPTCGSGHFLLTSFERLFDDWVKREFGKKLIESYLPNKELTHVIDTAGAYIPGHGTPTVILVARNQKPQGDQVRAVLGIRGEPSTPKDAGQGKVWRSIVELLENPGSENDFVSVVDQERGLYDKHP